MEEQVTETTFGDVGSDLTEGKPIEESVEQEASKEPIEDGVDLEGEEAESSGATEGDVVSDAVLPPSEETVRIVKALSDEKQLLEVCHKDALDCNGDYKDIVNLLSNPGALDSHLYRLEGFKSLSDEQKEITKREVIRELQNKRVEILNDYLNDAKSKLSNRVSQLSELSKLDNSIRKHEELSGYVDDVIDNLTDAICEANKIAINKSQARNVVANDFKIKLVEYANSLKIPPADLFKILGGRYKGSVSAVVRNGIKATNPKRINGSVSKSNVGCGSAGWDLSDFSL